MDGKTLVKMGIPRSLVETATDGIRAYIHTFPEQRDQLAEAIAAVVANPSAYTEDAVWGTLAKELTTAPPPLPEPINYRTWGTQIEPAVHAQMRQACTLPMATGAALMPDAHVGYGLPIGGVLALENAVVPYAVGVDIACRMKLSVLDIPPENMERRFELFRSAIERGTRFGVGSTHETPQDHPVMDEDWTITRVTREKKDTARKQLGTSGSGNHFVEFGVLTLTERAEDLDLDPGTYTALLSHSGSRGTGAAVCDTYSRIAQNLVPHEYQELSRLGWLSLDSAAGQEYWAAMNLMGDYAAANHDVIHRLVTKLLGARRIANVENHHNFAWKETHGGREVIVHRKGATPAGKGVLGVIPGSMADPAFVVRGLGNEASLQSASHGAGRLMSRTAALNTFSFGKVQRALKEQGVHVLSAGSDEVPGVYKNILDVMREQQDLVEIVARFDPKIVKMSNGGKAED